MPQNKEINLVSTENKKTIKYQRLKKKVRNLAIILTIAVLLVNVLTISFFFVMKKKMTANEAKINSLKKAIVSLDKNESYLLTISDRAKAAISLQKEKKPFLKSISDLESVLTTGFNLTSLEFGSSGELKLTATCDDRESLANFNDRIEQATQQGLFSKAVFSSIGRNKQGRYDFSLELKK